MATPADKTKEVKTALTFRKFKDGDQEWPSLQSRIFTADETDNQEVTLTIAASRAVKILSAESSDPFVTVKLEPVPGSNGKKYRLTAVQNSNTRSGYHFGRILVKTDSRLLPNISIFECGTVGTPGR